MAKDQVQWAAPSPLWPIAAGTSDIAQRRNALRKPVLLRFAADTFMDDFVNLLETDPSRMHELVATPETWRGPVTDPAPAKPAPLFARKLSRLGLAAAKKKGLVPSPGGKGVSSLLTLNTAVQPKKLKLYQPAHQRYYLVASSLVCGRAGLPDRAINTGRQEKAGYVLRRMFPPGPLDINIPLPAFDPATWEEYAFVSTSTGNRWQRIPKQAQANAGVLIDGEDQLPLFAMNFAEDDGRSRRLVAGLVPVGKREAYMGAGMKQQPGDPQPVVEPQPISDPRMILFWSQVTEPWKKLLEQAFNGSKMNKGAKIPDDPNDDPPGPVTLNADNIAATVQTMREQLQTGSWYVLLDFANLLNEQIPRVWRLLKGQAPLAGEPAFNDAENALATAITNTTFSLTELQKDAFVSKTAYSKTAIKSSLKDALLAVKTGSIEANLEAVKTSFDRKRATLDPLWPNFLFPFADPLLPSPISDKTALENEKAEVDAFAEKIQAALPVTPVAEVPNNPLVSQQPMDMREGWFVIRCVFTRPECGPIDPPLLSEPTAPFQMASFFDPDAPARPIRIALPLDTSPAGLRKFDKNTAFMISDMLCGQIDRVKGLSLADLVLSVLPWPLHKDLSVPDGGPCKSGSGIEFGMICSLSIPIITICALLLLMIIVFLLDIIFRWVPFFIFCFPLPKLKAKA
ncbi:MAG TPA: hypothetical protein VLB46_02910 [Pyrinomonadaceae bacterium]|nr:hypothetical protein [Pyrinomonadaceae bacterium]